MIDRKTLGVYNVRAHEYARLNRNEACDAQLAAFIRAMPAGGRVLDWGCGPGHLAAEMARHGLEVTALDASAEMVMLATEKTGINAAQAAFDDLDAEDVYDGIWANFSLLHARRGDMPKHLSACRRALRAGGLLHIGLKLGTGEARDRLGRFYTYYGEGEILQMLTTAGFTISQINRGRSRGLEGSLSDWITVTAHA